MAGKREPPEDIALKLRQVEVLHGQGGSVSQTARQIGVTVHSIADGARIIARAQGGVVRLEVSRTGHQRIGLAALIRRFKQRAREDAPFMVSLGPVAFNRSPPSIPSVAKRLRRAVFHKRVPPTPAIAIDEYTPAQHAPAVDARPPMGLRERFRDAPSARQSARKDRLYHGFAFWGSESEIHIRINGSRALAGSNG